VFNKHYDTRASVEAIDEFRVLRGGIAGVFDYSDIDPTNTYTAAVT
jgi:hypothetical protein